MRLMRAAIFALIAMAAFPAFAQDMAPASDTTRFLFDTGLLIAGGVAGLVAIAGLALRDVGLARTQNAPQVSLRTIGALGVCVFAFWLVGYNLIFTVETGGFLGDFQSWAPDDADADASGRASGAHWFFHATLAALGAGVVSSAISERVRLWPFLFFVAAWAALIYPIVAGWAWGNGYFAAEWSYRDAAGAGVVHLSAGAAALAAVNVIGPRNGRYGHGPSRPPVSTALPLSAFGIALCAAALFIVILALAGSFSTSEAAISAGRIAANSLIAVAGGSLAAMILTQTVYKRTGLVSAMIGAVAALVSISVDPLSPALWQAAMIGAIGGVIVTVTPPFLDRLRIDDAGFSIPAHLLCGLWGAVIAFWANENARLTGQVVGAAAIAGFSYLMSYLIWTALRFTIGVRNAPLEETPSAAAGNR